MAVVERLYTRVNVWIFCPPGRKKVAVSRGLTVPCVNKESVLSKMYISVHRFSADVLLPESAHSIIYNL